MVIEGQEVFPAIYEVKLMFTRHKFSHRFPPYLLRVLSTRPGTRAGARLAAQRKPNGGRTLGRITASFHRGPESGPARVYNSRCANGKVIIRCRFLYQKISHFLSTRLIQCYS